MSDSLHEKIKKKLGYTEEPAPACKNCIYSEEVENKYVDRMWDTQCHISGEVAVLKVSPHGRCKKFTAQVNNTQR